MATNWPNSVQTFTNPSPGDSLSSPSHADQHATVNDTVEALQQYAGLVLVKTQTIASGAGSVTVTDAFSSTFDNYFLQGNFYHSVSTATTLFQLSGITGSVYTGNVFFILTGSGGTETNANFTATYWDIGQWRYGGSMFVGYPNVAAYKMYSFAPNADTTYTRRGGGKCTSTTQSTGFTMSPSAGTFGGGTIRVYGFNDG